jgi:hypothetical protein
MGRRMVGYSGGKVLWTLFNDSIFAQKRVSLCLPRAKNWAKSLPRDAEYWPRGTDERCLLLTSERDRQHILYQWTE